MLFFFFIHLYWSAGESTTTLQLVFGLFPELEPRGPQKKMLDTSDEQLREQLLERLIDQKLAGPTHQTLESDPEKLEERMIPHGSMSNLYMMYIAYCRAGKVEAACKSTFYGIGKRWLTTCLSFQRKCNHAVCFTCTTLREAIRKATDFDQHAQLSARLLGHYTQMWRDREVYWMARERSESVQDLLTVIIDSYDKSKIQLPRWPGKRVPKKVIYEVGKSYLSLLASLSKLHGLA